MRLLRMEFLPGVIRNTVKYITCASRKQASPGMKKFPLLFENSRITSPAQEKKSPANSNLCNRSVKGFIFKINKIIRTGMISALAKNPGQKDDWFRRIMAIKPTRKYSADSPGFFIECR